MAESIKFTDKYIDTTGVYDSTLNKTQQVINSKLVTVDTSSSSIGTPNPVNADTFGGYALSNFVRTSQLVNNFTTATAGLYALDAAAGKTLNDSISYIQNTQIPNVEQYLLKFEIATVTVGTTSYYTVNTGHLYLRAAFFLYDTNYNYAITQDKRGLNLSFQDATLFIFQTGTIPSSGSRAIRILYGYLDL